MRKKYFLVIVVIGLYSLGSYTANNDLIPFWIKDFWWFDDVGHFFIFGLLAFSIGVFVQKMTSYWKYAYIAVALFELIDEGIQLFHVERTFSVLDIATSFLGIASFFLLHLFLIKRNIL
jgi:VanZ family protein